MKVWLGRLLLLWGGLCLGVLGAEGLSRVVRPDASADLLFNSPETSPRGLYVVDHTTLLSPRPGFTGAVRSPGYQVSLRINALGLRGPPPEDIAPDRPQWLAVGDSFTLSVQVEEDQTFAGRLATAMDSRPMVWNAGVDGDSTWQAAIRYARADALLPISTVILTFFLGNDLQDNMRFPHVVQSARSLPEGADIPRPPTSAWTAFLLRHSHLYAHARVWQRRASLLQGQDPDRERWRQELVLFSREGQRELARLLPQTREALRRLQQDVQQRGDTLLVALAPPAFGVESARARATFAVVGLDPEQMALDAPEQAVQRLLAELGLPACSLTAALRDTPDAYFVYDGHWTADGHAAVAQTLQTCLSSLPPPPGDPR